MIFEYKFIVFVFFVFLNWLVSVYILLVVFGMFCLRKIDNLKLYICKIWLWSIRLIRDLKV